MNKFYLFILTLFAGKFYSQDLSINSIPGDLIKNASAVVRLSEQNYILKSVNDLEITSSSTISILNKGGAEFSTIVIPYNPTTKVSKIKVELFDTNGKLLKTYSKKDFSDYTNNPSAALYVDDRILVLKVTSANYPYTVKTSYQTNTSNTVYLGTFSAVNAYDTSVEKTLVTISNPSGINIRTKVTDKPLAKVKQETAGSILSYSYENVPAVTRELLAPDLSYIVPQVQFSPEKFTLEGKQGDMADWNSFGKWYYSELLAPMAKVTPEIQAEVKALNLSGSTEEKVRALFQYMQSKTRYVLIAMGIGGWQPMAAVDVSKKGYGDCKALTNYMHTLLAAADIPSYFSVIYDSDTEFMFDKDFPKLSGNHAVLFVPTEDRPIWLENTSQRIAFNHLSFTSHHRNVLAVGPNGIDIIKTPTYKAEQSKEIMKANIDLAVDGSMTSKAIFTFSGGQYDHNLPLFSLNEVDLKETVRNRYSQLNIEQLEVADLNNDKTNALISYALKVTAAGFAKKLGDDLFFAAMPYYPSMLFPADEERQHPLEISFPFEDEYEIEFQAPEGYEFKEAPADIISTNEFGSYRLTFALTDNKIKVKRKLTIHKGIYPKEKYKEYTAFRRKTAANDNTKILLTKKT